MDDHPADVALRRSEEESVGGSRRCAGHLADEGLDQGQRSLGSAGGGRVELAEGVGNSIATRRGCEPHDIAAVDRLEYDAHVRSHFAEAVDGCGRVVEREAGGAVGRVERARALRKHPTRFEMEVAPPNSLGRA